MLQKNASIESAGQAGAKGDSPNDALPFDASPSETEHQQVVEVQALNDGDGDFYAVTALDEVASDPSIDDHTTLKRRLFAMSETSAGTRKALDDDPCPD